jgi:uncharacterized phage-like protein YoqJ
MTIKTIKSQTCCFTGHRPKSLPWRYNERSDACSALKHKLLEQIESAIQDGYRHFIIGMAQGIDTYVGELLILLKRVHPSITMEAAIPCESQCAKWSKDAKERYENIFGWCDKKTMINRYYTPMCMLERNHYMVDQSSRVIAVWNGKPSGTSNTVNYARKMGVGVVVIDV